MRRVSIFLACFLFVTACDDSAGCDEVLVDLDGPLAASAYFDEAAIARVTSSGVSFIETNLPPIIGSFTAADCGDVWCPDGWGTCDGADACQSDDANKAFIGVGVPAVNTEPDSFAVNRIRVCHPDEDPTFEDCNVYVRLDNISLDPNATDTDIGISVDATIWSMNIKTFIDYPFPFTSSVCNMYIRDAADTSQPVYKTITGKVDLDNGNALGRLGISARDIALTVDQDDLAIFDCILEYDWIKDIVWGFIEDSIKDQLDAAIDSTLVGLLSEGCAEGPCSRDDISSCDASDVCRFDSDGAAVPRLLGLEGQVALDALLGGFSGKADRVAFSTFANAGSTPSGGLTLELKAAAVAPQSDCVPFFPAPSDNMPSFSPSGSGYHAAIGASDRLVNTLVHEAFSSGALCQSLSGNDISALNSGAVSLLVPSLTELTGGTVPLTIDVLPRTPPEIQIGANITGVDADGATELIEPLLTLVMDDLDLDIYAERQGALFRVLTLRVDLAVDLSIAQGPNGELQLVAGDSSRWLQNTEVLNANVIAESAQDIEDAIPVLIGVVLPLLTDSLDQSFPLPSFSGFSLELDQITGSQTYGTTAFDKTRYAYVAVYSDLSYDPSNAQTVSRVETVAEVADVVLPDLEDLRAGEQVKVFIDADYERRQPEAGVVLWSKVDDGFWRPLTKGNELVIKDPVLHLEGRHTISVAAARAGVPRSQDESPEELEIITDFVAPRLVLQPSGNSLQLVATDTVATSSELVVSYSVDGLPRGNVTLDATGSARLTIDPAQHLIVVTARDLVGRETSVQIGQIPVAHGQLVETSVAEQLETETRSDRPDDVVSSSGCTQTSGSPWLGVLGLLGLAALRRRRR